MWNEKTQLKRLKNGMYLRQLIGVYSNQKTLLSQPAKTVKNNSEGVSFF